MQRDGAGGRPIQVAEGTARRGDGFDRGGIRRCVMLPDGVACNAWHRRPSYGNVHRAQGGDTTGVDKKDWRTRSSLFITVDDVNILIDTTPDFRQQALVNNVRNIDFVLYTHSHADHTHGIDDLRIFSYIKKDKLITTTPNTYATLPIFVYFPRSNS